MAVIGGLKKLTAQLQARAAKAIKDANFQVTVGFESAYAIFVHENMEMKLKGQPRPSGLGVYWGPNGQPKFLEQPFRQLQNDGTLARTISEAVASGKTLAQATLLAGLTIQRESQQLVPVEYGALKQSAFTRLEPKES